MEKETGMYVGKVKFYKKDKNYGFIYSAITGDIFFHKKDLDDAGIKDLQRDQKVSFDLGENPKTGKPLAINISLS